MESIVGNALLILGRVRSFAFLCSIYWRNCESCGKMDMMEVECESRREDACGVCWRVLCEEKEVMLVL